MTDKRNTYVTYNEGLESKHLHLGNLVHDYKNPNSVDPFVETAYTDISESPPSWAEVTSLENYALTLGSVDSTSPPQYEVVAAAKTTKVELKDPKSFFHSTTLASPAAKKWLRSHLSAAAHLAQAQSKHADTKIQPPIYILTGLILMTHATWTLLSSTNEEHEHAFVAGQQAPFDPTGVSGLRKLSVSGGVRPVFGFDESGHKEGTGQKVEGVEGAMVLETGKYPGARGWAAKWERVDARILEGGNGHGDGDGEVKLKLNGKVAIVELKGDVVHGGSGAEDDEGRGDFDDEYWDAFLDACEKYE